MLTFLKANWNWLGDQYQLVFLLVSKDVFAIASESLLAIIFKPLNQDKKQEFIVQQSLTKKEGKNARLYLWIITPDSTDRRFCCRILFRLTTQINLGTQFLSIQASKGVLLLLFKHKERFLDYYYCISCMMLQRTKHIQWHISLMTGSWQERSEK